MEKPITKKYTNGEVTVVWQPHMCKHSTLCWTQLLPVFNPAVRPWVNMNGAPTQRIIEQVGRCPSGALSFVMNQEAPGGSAEEETAP